MSARADRVMWFRHSSDINQRGRGAPPVIIALYPRPDPLPSCHYIMLTLNLLHCVFRTGLPTEVDAGYQPRPVIM